MGAEKIKLLNKIKSTIHSNIKWNSLIVIMAFSMTVIALSAVLIITSAVNNRYSEAISETTKRNNTQVVENVAVSIDSYLEEMVSVSESLSNFIKENQNITHDMLYRYNFILRNDIDTIAAFDRNANLLIKTDKRNFKENTSLASQNWFRSVAPGSQNYNISEPRVQSLYNKEYPWVLSLSKGFSWIKEGKKRNGVILVDLNFKSIKELCSKELGENGYIYILGSHGELIYHPQQQMIYYGIKDKVIPQTSSLQQGSSIINVDNSRMIVCVKKLKNTDWRVVGVSPINGLFSYGNDIKDFLSIILTVVALLVVFISLFVSFMINRPIRQLINLMGKVEEGKLDTFAQAQGFYEVNQLSCSFNNMVYRIKKLMTQVVDEQKLLRKSELKMLYAQINPHFLYNTLDSIVWMAESGDNKNVVKMISALANFFRLSLNRGKDTITVEEELKHAENYLIIQKMRFNDRFEYEISAQEEVLQSKTLKIVLQPIIENAIIHGVANLPVTGKITITAMKHEDKLVFKVIDNGYGIPSDILCRILDIDPQNKSGIGVKNVNARIQLLFGSEYGLKYESELDEGTTVTICLPYLK